MENSNENRRFCSACGAILTGTNFCGECGAKVLITAVHTPEPQEEVMPVETVAPAVESVVPAERMVAPVVEAPAAATLLDEKPAAWKFPLISVILMGILVIMHMIELLPQLGSLGSFLNWNGIAQLAATFVLSCVEMCCYIALLIGMMACKKQRNVVVALGFIMLTLCGMIGGPVRIASYMSNYGFGFGYSLYLSIHSWIGILFNLLIAVSYLIAKPKAAKLKMAACIAVLGVKFLILGIDLIIIRASLSDFIASFFNFLISDVALYLSVLLYTPFKKR